MYLQPDNSSKAAILLSGIAICSPLHYPFERHPSTHMVDSTHQGCTILWGLVLCQFATSWSQLEGRNLDWENVHNKWAWRQVYGTYSGQCCGYVDLSLQRCLYNIQSIQSKPKEPCSGQNQVIKCGPHSHLIFPFDTKATKKIPISSKIRNDLDSFPKFCKRSKEKWEETGQSHFFDKRETSFLLQACNFLSQQRKMKDRVTNGERSSNAEAHMWFPVHKALDVFKWLT